MYIHLTYVSINQKAWQTDIQRFHSHKSSAESHFSY